MSKSLKTSSVKRNSQRQIDKKWQLIFDKYQILEHIDKHGTFTISSLQINEFKQARLMTKFDYINSLPDLFYSNGLSILPISRGSYIIGRFNAYSKISNTDEEFEKDIIELPFPSWIETLNHQNVTSEATLLNAAYISGMIHELTGDKKIYQTVSGRGSSESFDFFIRSSHDLDKRYSIEVNNSQLEIDAGFETPDSLMLVEAKNNVTSSFLIRQLYYPFRLWEKKIKKKTQPVYLQYKNGIYNFSLFEFIDKHDYNSLILLDRKNFVISEPKISTNLIHNILERDKYVQEPIELPFPQANTFMVIIETLTSIKNSEEGKLTLEELTLSNDFVLRQAHYYSRAGAYLGVIKINNDKTLSLTELGANLINSSSREQKIILIELVLSHRPFAEAMKLRLRTGRKLSQTETFRLMQQKQLLSSYQYSFETQGRRSSTINAWIEEIFRIIES